MLWPHCFWLPVQKQAFLCCSNSLCQRRRLLLPLVPLEMEHGRRLLDCCATGRHLSTRRTSAAVQPSSAPAWGADFGALTWVDLFWVDLYCFRKHPPSTSLLTVAESLIRCEILEQFWPQLMATPYSPEIVTVWSRVYVTPFCNLNWVITISLLVEAPSGASLAYLCTVAW